MLAPLSWDKNRRTGSAVLYCHSGPRNEGHERDLTCPPAAIVRLGWVGVNWAATGPGESREEVVYRAASNSPTAIP